MPKRSKRKLNATDLGKITRYYEPFPAYWMIRSHN
jgi:hypothetical protein